jgi:hypothetical protein
MYHYRESGLPNIYLANGYREVATAEGPGIAIEDVEGLHWAIALDLVEGKPTLTAGDADVVDDDDRDDHRHHDRYVEHHRGAMAMPIVTMITTRQPSSRPAVPGLTSSRPRASRDDVFPVSRSPSTRGRCSQCLLDITSTG